MLSKKIYQYWNNENMDILREYHTQYSQKINLLACILEIKLLDLRLSIKTLQVTFLLLCFKHTIEPLIRLEYCLQLHLDWAQLDYPW